MTLKDQIAALLAKAAPLRELEHDDPRAAPLAGIVDEINRLRAQQEAEARSAWMAGYVAENPPVAPEIGYTDLTDKANQGMREYQGADPDNAAPEGGDALPSREELEEAAAKAGITFGARIADRTLFERLKKAGAL